MFAMMRCFGAENLFHTFSFGPIRFTWVPAKKVVYARVVFFGPAVGMHFFKNFYVCDI